MKLKTYEDYSNRERELGIELLTKLGCYDIETTDNESSIDVKYTTPKGNKCIGEIKVRSFPIDMYPTHIAEKDKLRKLEGYYYYDNSVDIDKVCYINFFPNKNGYDTIIYDISHRFDKYKKQNKRFFNIENFKTISCPVNSFTNHYIDKEVYFLSYLNGIDYIKRIK
ncbi:MAG: hypothetical protein ACOCRK_02780 [bacterium]